MNKHGLLSYHSFLPFLCAPSKRRSLACHIAPSLSSSKTNKDIKHQSCSWLIKEDLKYFPLCLTWFWVSPTRGITTGRNKMTLFFCCWSISLLQRLSRPNLSLFFDLVGSNYSKVVFLSLSFSSETQVPPLSPLTVPFQPPDYDIQSSRLKQQSVRGSLSFEVDVSQLCFCPGPEHWPLTCSDYFRGAAKQR